MDRQAFRNRMQ
jgi:hypothetical protein